MKVELELTRECAWRTGWNAPRSMECVGGKITDYTGRHMVETGEDCPRCKGKGEVLTEIGREIVLLVRQFADVAEEDL